MLSGGRYPLLSDDIQKGVGGAPNLLMGSGSGPAGQYWRALRRGGVYPHPPRAIVEGGTPPLVLRVGSGES